jgi:hypothetical protein
MRILTIFFFLLATINCQAFDWGKTGHRTTGAIAQQYLTKKTKKAIASLLDGQSLAFASTYADEIKSDDRYRSYGPWHYVNVPFDKTYQTHPKNESGDIIQGIDKCVEVLKSNTASRADKAFHLKLLIHFIGDLHQPMHVGLSSDKGGNDFQVQWYRDGTNLHSVWDTKMIESYGMSYTELAHNMPQINKKERKSIAAGDHRDWMRDSRKVIKEIYARTDKGDQLGYRYMYEHFNTVRNQLQKGGIRLAALLNELFG